MAHKITGRMTKCKCGAPIMVARPFNGNGNFSIDACHSCKPQELPRKS